MTRTLVAFMAAVCLALGFVIADAASHCHAMAAPVETYQPPVHKKPIHKAPAAKPQARPSAAGAAVEAPAPVVCPELPPPPVAAPAPPPAPPAPHPLAWLWKVLGFTLVGGALAALYHAGRTIYAGYKSSKGTANA